MINNCGCTSKWLISEKYRRHCLNCSKSMMVNNLKYFCIINSLNCLILLIMVNKNYLLLICIQKISSGNHSHILILIVEYREIPISLLRHYSLDIVHIIPGFELNNIIPCHKIADWHTLINKSCCRVCVMWRNYACRLHLNGTQLRLISVSEYYKIILFNIAFHEVRISCSN